MMEDRSGMGQGADSPEGPPSGRVSCVSGDAQGEPPNPTRSLEGHRPGIRRRAARIVGVVRSETRHEPREMVIDSDHIADVVAAPWITRQPWYAWINSLDFAKDDPEALRASGPQAVGSALAGLAQHGQAAGRRDVREVAALIRTWLVEDAGRFDSLDRDLGLSPRDGQRPLGYLARKAERDALVIERSRELPYSSMTARRAAQALRDACKAYEKRRWPVDRDERKTRPQGENGIWWQIMQLDLPFPMPGEETLLKMIEADRGPDQTRLPLLG